MNKKFIASLALVSFFLSRCPCPLQADASERIMTPTESNQTVPPPPEQAPASPPAEAGSPAVPETPNAAAPSPSPLGPEDGDEDEEPKGTPVAPSDVDPQKSGSKKFWTNILIAGVAVLVAVVSILVVSNNNGSKN